MSGKTHSPEALIRAQDLIYSQAGTAWSDGLILGNGNLGVTAYAPAHLEWCINKVDVYDSTVPAARYLTHPEVMKHVASNPNATSFFLDREENAPDSAQTQTLSAALLRLKPWNGVGWNSPALPLVSQRLNLYDAELVEELNAFQLHSRLEQFVPRGRNGFCLRFREQASGQALAVDLVRPANEALPDPVWHQLGDATFGMTQKLPGEAHEYAVVLSIHSLKPDARPALKHGRTYASILGLSGDADLFLTVKTTHETADPLACALAEVRELERIGFDGLRREHRDWWHRFWARGWASFDSAPAIQKAWTFSLYELACSYGKTPMPGLNGLFYGPVDALTPGLDSQGYTHDQNVQIPAMPFFPLNRYDFIEVFADTYTGASAVLKQHTQALFGHDGIGLPLVMNQEGVEYPTASYRYTLCGSAYSGLILALAWKFSRDPVLLREKLYPLLREFVRFYCGLAVTDADGSWHLDWSVPPEIFTFTRNDNCTLALFRVCLETAVEAAQILDCDAVEAARWREMLAHYPTLCKQPDGAWWCGPDVPFDHYMFGGHLLYPFFPAESDLDPEAAARTLEYIETRALERSYADTDGRWHHVTDWSAFLTTAARIRLRQPGAWEELERFQHYFEKPNGLFSHNPVVILPPETAERNYEQSPPLTCRTHSGLQTFRQGSRDCTPNPDAKRYVPPALEGNSAFLFLATETLLQSHGGLIRLFPAVPEGFSGSFVKLLAQGAFEVSAEIRRGEVTGWEVHALRGGLCRLLESAGSAVRETTLAPGEIWRSDATDSTETHSSRNHGRQKPTI